MTEDVGNDLNLVPTLHWGRRTTNFILGVFLAVGFSFLARGLILFLEGGTLVAHFGSALTAALTMGFSTMYLRYRATKKL